MRTLAINSGCPVPRRVAAKPVVRAKPKLVGVAPRELAPRQDRSPRANKLGIGARFGVAALLHAGVMLAVQQSAHAPAPVAATQPLALDFAPPPEPPKPRPRVAKAPAPVSEPRGYLKNPAPEYPLQAQERGQQGRVILKVHVLASGKPDSVTVDKSTGVKILDDAAVKAVLSFTLRGAGGESLAWVFLYI